VVARAPAEDAEREAAAGRLLDAVVVSHTHWDREWYHPAGRFRQRLVALVDELLDDPPPAAGPDSPQPSFLLDGQAVVIDDYLAVRPERASELAARLRAGALEAGPWYVLADELTPGAEALVRNLLAGRRALQALGAAAPPVLYCPDTFGHPAALPALAVGFGLPLIILWRGYGGRRWPAGDAFRWRAPDGSHAVVFHLPPDGYEFASNLPADRDGAERRWARMCEVLAPRSALGLLLLQNGADHHARQLSLERALDELTRAARPHRVHRGSLAGFAREVLVRAYRTPLPDVRGELRDSYGYTWTLQGTFATRAHQKRRNAHAERLLTREAEPWSALARFVADAPSRAPLLHAAWRTLLLCHPHDTLCGCSTDEVARAMEARLDDVVAQGRGARFDALLDVVGHDPVVARERRDRWRPVMIVRNSAARPRSGVTEVTLSLFARDVPVGPGSAPHAGADTSSHVGRPASLGPGVPLQVLGRQLRHERTESPRHYPDDDLVEAVRAVAWVPEVAGYGTRAFAIEAEHADPAEPLSGRDGVAPVRAADNVLDNGLLRVQVGPQGAVRLTSAALGVDIPDLVGFEDVGDRGDLYTHSPLGAPSSSTWFGGARTVHAGPLRGELELRWRMRVPIARAEPDAGDRGASARRRPAARGARTARHVELEMTVRVVLDAGCPFVRLRVSGDNRARDHRLRIVVRTGMEAAEVWADAAFGPVQRVPIEVPPEDRAAETPPATAPLHRYVSLFGQRAGVTVLSDGLAEYEATDSGDVAVTVVRAVGELSRNDLPERPGHAGWPVPTPEAQSLGPFAAELAVLPHGARERETVAHVERCADDFLLPLRGTTLRSALSLPHPTRGLELEGEGVAFGAAKESDDGEWLVLRCVNLLERPVDAAWRVGFPISRAVLARLDETPLDELPADGDRAHFRAGPRGVITVLVR